MNMNDLIVKTIDPLQNLGRVTALLLQLNPDKDESHIKQLLYQMPTFKNYTCFGLFDNDRLLGVSSGCTSSRIYCGKQLEIDNVVIDENLQSNGLGALFLNKIEEWALQKE